MMKSYEKKPAAPERIIQTVAATLRAVIYLRNRDDGRFSFITNTSIDAFGHRFDLIESLHSRAFLHLVHPADRRKVVEHRNALDGCPKGNVATVLMRLHHADGGWRWLGVRESVYAHDEEGKLLLILGVIEDRTEELMALERQKDSDARLRLTLQHLPAVVFELDQEGRFTFIEGNGFAHKAALGDSFFSLHPENQELHKAVREALNGKRSSWVVKTDGRTLNIDSVLLKDPSGAPSRLVGVAIDRTEELRYQNQLLHSEKLASLGGLVAGVAHEINNPLAVIGGLAQLLERNPDMRVQEDARSIRRMTNRAARIVRSLLTFARRTGQESRKEALFRPLIEETLELITHPLAKASVTLDVSLEDEEALLWIDSGHIQQVLLNLLTNAIHAVSDKEKAQRRIRLTTRRAEQGVYLEVADTGMGIPPENIPRIFDPFFTTKDVGEGTGMGLSICHGIAAAHGGHLTVESTVGEGTTFRLWLPLANR